MDKNKMDVEKFLKKFPANFIIAYDPNGDVATQYNVMVMPSSYLIDRNGKLYLSHAGFRDKDKSSLETAIKTLLKE
jgi:peroxiredoxin